MDLYENRSENSLKGDPSNDTTDNPPLFSLVNTFNGCCYFTVDSAMAASQNGFCFYKLSIHKKTNIMQIMT